MSFLGNIAVITMGYLYGHCRVMELSHFVLPGERDTQANQIKSKSNQILFKVDNILLKEKKISKKLFTRLYSITNNNKLI